MPFSRDLPDPGMEPVPRLSPALAGGFFISSTTWEALPCVMEIKMEETLFRLQKQESGPLNYF